MTPHQLVKGTKHSFPLRALGFEKPLELCPGFRLEDLTYSIHTFSFFFFTFFFKMGLVGNPFFLKCPITWVFRNTQGSLNISESGSEPRHTLEITCMSVW